MTRGSDSRTEAFGELLQKYRAAAGLSQEALAARSGLSRDAISMLERGVRSSPRPNTVRRLTEALRLRPSDRDALQALAVEAGGPRTTARDRRAPAGLEVPSTPFVGREAESAMLQDMLRRPDVRLLTLTGSPGVGKTRLGLEVTRYMAGRFEDGFVLVALAPVADPSLVMPAIGQALDLTHHGTGPVVEVVVERCHRRDLLLVLDNFEHLLAAAPDLLQLLARCPRLRVLVTSRAPLGVRGEQQLQVPPLELPSAVQLFVERAQAVEPRFRLTTMNADAVAAICRRLDRLPLALELAAPWIRLLRPDELLERLDRQLELLVDGPRDLPERQRTMRATLDWSCELLDEDARRLLRRLSVFAGSASLEGLEAVCQAAGPLSGGPLRHLAALVDHGLVGRYEAATGEPRVTMLDSVREHAREQLSASGELEATARAHAGRYASLAERASAEREHAGGTAWLERLRTEQHNLWAAIGWAAERREAEIGLRLAGALWHYWDVSGHRLEGLRWLEQMLAADACVAPAIRAEAVFAVGFIAWTLGSNQMAATRFRESLATFQRLGDRYATACALNALGLVAGSQADYAGAISWFEQAVALVRELDRPSLLARALVNMGACLSCRGDADCSKLLYAEALTIRPDLAVAVEPAAGVPYLVHRAGRETNPDLARALLDAQMVIAGGGVPHDGPPGQPPKRRARKSSTIAS